MYKYDKKYSNKYFCNECFTEWFSDTIFEDLCPHCESEHIFSLKIKKSDKTKAADLAKEIKKMRVDIKRKLKQLETITWIKAKHW